MSNLDTALRRSLEAELATDDTVADPSPETHGHAAQLHREAAEWHHRASNPRRAHLHRLQSTVHAAIAQQLRDQEPEGRPS